MPISLPRGQEGQSATQTRTGDKAGAVGLEWRRDSIREVIHVRRNTLVRCLLAHDERDLVERVPSVTDEELERIGERADWYAFSSEDAMPNDSMGTSRAISLAAVDVLEGASRELKRSDGERDPGVEERALRRLRLPFNPVKNRHLVD
jgi:hypothetical protein